MDIKQKMNELMKEAFSLFNYKRMPLALAILSAICVLPFTLVFFGLVLALYILVFLFKCLDSPGQFLLDFIKQEGKDVKHFTQGVIYLIGFPIVFLLKVMLAFYNMTMFLLYFFANAFGYIASVGGITFCPFVQDECKRDKIYNNIKIKNLFSIIFVGIFSLLLAAGLVLVIISKPKLVKKVTPENYTYYQYLNEVNDAYQYGFMTYDEFNSFSTLFYEGLINDNNYQDFFYFLDEYPYSRCENYYSSKYVSKYETGKIGVILLFGTLIFDGIYVPIAFKKKEEETFEE